MLVVAGTFQIKPEQREAAVKLMLHVVAETKKEAGCYVYDFYADLSDNNLFHVFEEWENMERLQAHFLTPHIKELGSALPDLLTEPAQMSRNTSSPP